MPVRLTIASQMQEIATSHDKTLAPLSDELPLLETGLDSLCFAILVARLEDELGVDPFTAADDVTFPVSFGDFVHLYEAAAQAAA